MFSLFLKHKKIILILLTLTVFIMGCSADLSDETFHPNETFRVTNPENENLAGLLQEKAGGAMVQISTDKVTGSGCIWSMNEEKTVIVTAGHVLEGAEEVQLTFIDGTDVNSAEEDVKSAAGGIKSVVENAKSAAGENAWQWKVAEYCDLGWIILSTELISPDTRAACCYVATDKEIFDAMKAEDIILVMGSLRGTAESAYEGKLIDPWIYMEDYAQYMMLGVDWQGIDQPGMSGSGVFNSQGYLIGVLSGADEKGNLAIVPLSLILSEWELEK